ncbi:hypothetical protein C805_00022 [Eubacterium sp. 14-2]|uniref:hypothetical protein n=1 Tax=Eubacterium sp. 14-2 TaxID=1235790 RepID=UPI0003398C63|nr:hypothetical protein [Eubacterium sp. 14-2]EOT29439.1 hypothetical protein C805_00022 [Eubacterium sp. 14-2]
MKLERINNSIEEKLKGSGWEEIGTGVFVPEDNAFDYALERCFEVVPNFVHRLKWTKEFKDMLVEWFYSGNWIKED